jgi:phosphoglycerol transferase MdoB-like AlkP superfamily enzyme
LFGRFTLIYPFFFSFPLRYSSRSQILKSPGTTTTVMTLRSLLLLVVFVVVFSPSIVLCGRTTIKINEDINANANANANAHNANTYNTANSARNYNSYNQQHNANTNANANANQPVAPVARRSPEAAVAPPRPEGISFSCGTPRLVLLDACCVFPQVSRMELGQNNRSSG